LQFSLQETSPESSGYTLVWNRTDILDNGSTPASSGCLPLRLGAFGVHTAHKLPFMWYTAVSSDEFSFTIPCERKQVVLMFQRTDRAVNAMINGIKSQCKLSVSPTFAVKITIKTGGPCTHTHDVKYFIVTCSSYYTYARLEVSSLKARSQDNAGLRAG
jgi:hypothetical protein